MKPLISIKTFKNSVLETKTNPPSCNNRNSARSENPTDWKTALTQSLIRVSRATFYSISECHFLTSTKDFMPNQKNWLSGNLPYQVSQRYISLTHLVHPNFCNVCFFCYTRFIIVSNFCNMSFVVGTR